MKIFITAIFILFLSITLFASGVDKIELENLDGKWKGSGSFLVPGIHTKVEIEGAANFKFDKKTKKLRTELRGEKFMFTYSDSGYLYIDPKTDSVSWEVWDNRNKHAKYYGIRKGNAIYGKRNRGKDVYELKITQTTKDKIMFKLIITEPDGDVFDKAAFDLHRVK